MEMCVVTCIFSVSRMILIGLSHHLLLPTATRSCCSIFFDIIIHYISESNITNWLMYTIKID